MNSVFNKAGRWLSGWLALALVVCATGSCARDNTRDGASAQRRSVVEFGAVGDGRTVNTTAIQTAIDRCAAAGGGT